MKNNLLMTEGKPLWLLTSFSLPILMGNLLHQAYSITDSIVVGRCLGETSLAAIGCTAPVAMLLAALMIGVNVGMGILVSQAFGRKDYQGIRQCLSNGIYLSVLIAIFIGVCGTTLASPLLKWMGTPAGPLQQAVVYLQINFATAFCPLFYYLLSSVLRGIGDSRSALYCLIVSSVINIVLDFCFVALFHWGVGGSAWATAIAQAISALMAVLILYKKYPEVAPRPIDFQWNTALFLNITKTALPIAVQSAFNNVSNLVAQSAVNSFGESAMAAYTAAGRIGTLSLMPVETIGNALSVYAGQNHGASMRERVRSGVRAGFVLCVVVSLPLGVLLAVFGTDLCRLFLPQMSGEVIQISRNYLLISAVPCILAGVMHIFQQTLRGVDMVNQALLGGLMQLVTKIIFAAVGAWCIREINVVWLGWPLSFVAGSILPMLYLKHYLEKPVIQKSE